MAYAVGVFVCCLFYIMYLVVFIFVYHRRYATIETLINSQISYMEFVYIKNNKKEKGEEYYGKNFNKRRNRKV